METAGQSSSPITFRINPLVSCRHHLDAESGLHVGTTRPRVELPEPIHRRSRLLHRVDQEAGLAFSDQFRQIAVSCADDRRAAGLCFDPHPTAWLTPGNREEHRSRPLVLLGKLFLRQAPQVRHVPVVQVRLHLLVEERLVLRLDHPGQTQRSARQTGNLDRAVRPLFRRKTPGKQQIVFLFRTQRKLTERDAVVDGRHIVQIWFQLPLGLGERHERLVAVAVEHADGAT